MNIGTRDGSTDFSEIYKFKDDNNITIEVNICQNYSLCFKPKKLFYQCGAQWTNSCSR